MSDYQSIYRTVKNKNYSVIANHIFQDATISMATKGLFAYLMTLPDDWKIYQKEIAHHFPDGLKAVARAFKELETNGYVIKKRVKNEKNQFIGWDYFIYEYPQEQQLREQEEEQNSADRASKSPFSLNADSRMSGNGNLLNTKRVLNTDSCSSSKRNNNNSPELTEIHEYNKETGNKIDADYFYNYYKSRDWKTGNNQITDWKALFDNWIKIEKNKRPEKKQTEEVPKPPDCPECNSVLAMAGDYIAGCKPCKKAYEYTGREWVLV